MSIDGTISTVFQVPAEHAIARGDFAGRYGETIEAMDVTQEGGIAVIVDGDLLRPYYLAPPQTRRTLVALRDARVSQRRVRVTVDATSARQPAVAGPSKRQAGCRRCAPASQQADISIAVNRRFARAYHDVRVTLRA